MALNNDIIDLTGAAGAADEFVVGGRVNQASGNLELDMNIGGNSAIQIPLLNSMPPDEYVTGARYNQGTGEIELDLCIAGAKAITFQLLNQLPRDVFITNGHYDPSTMAITFIYSDGRPDLVLDLSTIIMSEKAGANYDPTHSYNTGDVVSVPGSENLYIALKSGVLADPVVTPADWKTVSSERGGIAWSATTEYHAGDIVTIASDDELYIAMADNVNSDPLLRTDWYEFGAARHIVGWFTPDGTNPPASEYPDTTGQEPGAVWYTSGVDQNTGYTFTDGPFLGFTAMNNDKFVWYGFDSSGQDIWLFEPFPRISNLERGGVQWKDNKNYIVDDIVAFGQDIYIANTDNTNAQPVTSPEWNALSLSEKGGLLYDDTASYNEGDIVSQSGAIYTAITSVPPGHTPPDAAYWSTPVLVETGGKVWDPAQTYRIGDVVTDNTDGNVYTAIVDSTGDAPSTNPGAWKRVGDDLERGGVSYDATINYNKGDIVADPVAIPHIVYISLSSNNLGHDLTDTQWWQELDSIFYNAPTGGREDDGTPDGGVLHDPTNPTSEYPDCSQEHEGAIWYITGIGKDANGDPNRYTFTTGPLTGISVADWDKIVWVNGNDTSDCMNNTWLWSPFPRIKAERGGIAWRSGLEYDKGDTAVDLGDFMLYKSTINGNIGNQPSLGSGWEAVSPPPESERGGVAWNNTTNYSINDVVIDNTDGELYRALTSNTSKQPSNNGSDWEKVVPHMSYDGDTTYKEGDIIYYDGRLYAAPTGGIGPGIVPTYPPTPGEWELVSMDETGGVLWNTNKVYAKSTIVTVEDGQYVKMYLSLVDDNIGNDPITSSDEWSVFFSSESITQTGHAFKNLIINGNMEINQRSFYEGDGFTANEYAWDRWYITDTAMTQIIEEDLYIPNTLYTLSGFNVTTTVIQSPSSGHWVLPDIPRAAREVQLELGQVATGYEKRPKQIEQLMCYRYFQMLEMDLFFTHDGSSNNDRYYNWEFPVEMRVDPTVIRPEVGSGKTSKTRGLILKNKVTFWSDGDEGHSPISTSRGYADAEIYI